MSQKCKDCNGRGFEWVLETHTAPCETCEGKGGILRTGPYRLADGTWSDGVDRTKRIDSRPCSSRYEVTTGKKYSHVWHEDFQAKEFDTWEEAIAYADKQARTTTNGETK